MTKPNNYTKIPYLTNPQHKALKSVKEDIKREYKISISITRIIRDIDDFMLKQIRNLKDTSNLRFFDNIECKILLHENVKKELKTLYPDSYEKSPSRFISNIIVIKIQDKLVGWF